MGWTSPFSDVKKRTIGRQFEKHVSQMYAVRGLQASGGRAALRVPIGRHLRAEMSGARQGCFRARIDNLPAKLPKIYLRLRR